MQYTRSQWLCLSLPVLITGQISLAGLALFLDAEVWTLHIVFGFLLLLPIAFITTSSRARGLREKAWLVAVLYAVQVTLGALIESASYWPIAIHFINALLLLLASIILASDSITESKYSMH
ncbi:hypothetical protein FKG94_16280 [Exilibacterium tricleocarpae]|uniref:Uncharacterized protein n=1 Tax=Exilibacterium tricleocarpae TaxID=2591008 RepID=A0A545TAD4_9GAMM|nr:DUF6220 domain-containing protein [Exilibacterium tricleocarpae]TQV74165.1 hypothetical protein FKG94_16280 [Exilibacterium tricleocarpae]